MHNKNLDYNKESSYWEIEFPLLSRSHAHFYWLVMSQKTGKSWHACTAAPASLTIFRMVKNLYHRSIQSSRADSFIYLGLSCCAWNHFAQCRLISTSTSIHVALHLRPFFLPLRPYIGLLSSSEKSWESTWTKSLLTFCFHRTIWGPKSQFLRIGRFLKATSLSALSHWMGCHFCAFLSSSCY